MALGNAVGSVICDTALIFGLCCVLTRLPKNRFVLHRHGWLQLGAGALLLVTALVAWLVSGDIANVTIGRPVGLLYLAGRGPIRRSSPRRPGPNSRGAITALGFFRCTSP